MRWFVVLVLAGISAVGCGTAGSARSEGTQQRSVRSQLERALQRWRQFPVASAVRPNVLLISRRQAPPGGFSTPEAHMAFDAGRFRLDVKLSDTREVSRDGLSLISQAAAYAVLRGGTGSGQTTSGGSPLQVRAVRLGHVPVATDRGLRKLTAWLFYLREVASPAAVVASAQGVEMVPTGALGITASVTDGGRTLRVHFFGAPEGTTPCDAQYVVQHAESRQAVAIAIERHAVTIPVGTACVEVAYLVTISVPLKTPLGARVVVVVPQGMIVPVSSVTAMLTDRRSDPIHESARPLPRAPRPRTRSAAAVPSRPARSRPALVQPARAARLAHLPASLLGGAPPRRHGREVSL